MTAGAKVLGVSRQALNNLLNGKSGIRPEIVVRLAKAFSDSPATWLAIQMDYDLAQMLKHPGRIVVRRVRRLADEPRP
ncbi:MAG TPA: HigA family addiction module antitoxin [Candidatus Binataceae bacterium]|nr:HigA family addiction module antitoxin [Candidatus Binataceae bacterium]